jgi:putative oxidoreductase
MSRLVYFFQLRMLPPGVNLALLVLRLGFGLALLLLHGWSKLTGYSAIQSQFPDPWGLGAPTTLALAIFAEVICAGLVAIGLFTRFGALVCTINMAAAFYHGHGMRLTGENNGEMAFLYLLGFVAILLAGPGRFAIDSAIGAPSATPVQRA